MKMKKVLAIVLVVAIAAALCIAFAACGKNEKQEVKFGLITLHDKSSTYDKNFIDALEEVCEELKIPYIVKSGIKENNECYDAAADLVDQGCNVIFADSFGHEPYIIKAAKEFKDVQFFHATGTKAHTEKLSNFHNAFASIYEGRYLAGVAAGMKLKAMQEAGAAPATSPKIGYVGAFTYAEVMSGYTSFYLGVKSIVSDVTMDVTFTGSWYDETAEKEAANRLIAGGCVLISQHADSMGAPNACEEAGVPDVSYNGSTYESCPNTFLVSSRIDWAPYYKYAIKQVVSGQPVAKDWNGTLANGGVKLTNLGTATAPGTVAKLCKVRNELAAGTVQVFDVSKFTVNNQHITEYQADVNSDAAFTPDTQVVKTAGGITYVAESDLEIGRSAPYFAMIIDGITVLGA